MVGNADGFDEGLFVQQLADSLGICACRIVVINISQRKDTNKIAVTFQILEKNGEQLSATVIDTLQEQVNSGTLILSGMAAQSVQIVVDNNSSSEVDNSNSTSITIAIVVVVGVFGIVIVISVACVAVIVSAKRKNVIHPSKEHKTTLEHHKDRLVQATVPVLPPITEQRLSRFLHSSFSVQPPKIEKGADSL